MIYYIIYYYYVYLVVSKAMLFQNLQTLYTFPDNFRAFKVLVAAQYSGAKVQASADFEFGKTNKSDDFLRKFPVGKVCILCLFFIVNHSMSCLVGYYFLLIIDQTPKKWWNKSKHWVWERVTCLQLHLHCNVWVILIVIYKPFVALSRWRFSYGNAILSFIRFGFDRSS